MIGGSESDAGSVRSYGEDSPEDAVRVTRSIMIVKPPGYQTHNGSAPPSPAGSTPPVSPFSGKVVNLFSLLYSLCCYCCILKFLDRASLIEYLQEKWSERGV